MDKRSGLVLAERYQKNPVLKGLVQLIPFGIGSALDAGLAAKLEKIRQERLRCFFDELETGHLDINEDLINSEDFLHCYFATIRAVANTHRREKIMFFARLFHGVIISDLISDVDEYEEMLETLDEVSYREICILEIIDGHSMALKGAYDPWSEKLVELWNLCGEEIVKKTGIPVNELRSAIRRLDRTGLVDQLFGSKNQVIDDTAVVVSARYLRLKKVLGMNSTEIIDSKN